MGCIARVPEAWYVQSLQRANPTRLHSHPLSTGRLRLASSQTLRRSHLHALHMVLTDKAASPHAANDRRYRLFGDFWLSSPEHHLHPRALQRLRQLEPHLRELESAATPG